jgi:hypothetical protein
LAWPIVCRLFDCCAIFVTPAQVEIFDSPVKSAKSKVDVILTARLGGQTEIIKN